MSSNLIRWGGLAAIASAICAVLSFILYTAIVGDDRLSDAATSAVFFLPSGAQLLAMVLLLVDLARGRRGGRLPHRPGSAHQRIPSRSGSRLSHQALFKR